MIFVSCQRLAQPRSLTVLDRAVLVLEIVLLRIRSGRAFRREADTRAAVRALRRSRVVAPLVTEAERERVIARLAWITPKVLQRLPGERRCLMQSLVLTGLLSRRGLTSNIVIGVSGEGSLSAHAWVTVDGQPVSDPGDHQQLAVL